MRPLIILFLFMSSLFAGTNVVTKTMDCGDTDYQSVRDYLESVKSPQGKIIMIPG